jgi:hypothetical protein
MSLTESCKIISIISYFFHSLLFENRYQKRWKLGERKEKKRSSHLKMLSQKLDDSYLLRFRLTIKEFDVKV